MMDILPVLVKNAQGVALVEAAGQPVITSQDMAMALEYQGELSINRVFARHRAAFRDLGTLDAGSAAPEGRRFDTCLVRVTTPGGPQDVRVFTKHGALKVCMKSNQPRAIAVQEMLIDLYEKVESGQLVGAARFGGILRGLAGEMRALKRELAHLKERPPLNINLPDDTALPIALERKVRKRSHNAIWRHPEARELAIRMLNDGAIYDDVTAALNRIEGFKTSRSAAARFWTLHRRGYLKWN